MDQVIRLVIDKVGENIGFIIGVLAIAAILVPQLVRLWEIWADIRTGKKRTIAARTHLEILKLRYEIEALKKQHGLAPLSMEEISETTVSDKADTIEDKEGVSITNYLQISKLKPPWAWLRFLHRHSPILARITSSILTTLLGFISITLILFTSFGFTIEMEKEQGAWLGLVAFLALISIAFIVLTFVSYIQRRRLRNFANMEASNNSTKSDTGNVTKDSTVAPQM